MELNKIEKLLDNYFEGNTTLKEEALLKTYFATNNVPEHLQDYKAMFSYFAINKEEISTKPIKVNTKKKTFKMTWLMTSVAAALLLFVSVYNLKQQEPTATEIKNAQIAFNETKKAFKLISENLNKGNKAIAYLNEYESTKNKIFKVK